MEKIIDQKRIATINNAYLFGLIWRNKNIGTEYILEGGKITGIIQGNKIFVDEEK